MKTGQAGRFVRPSRIGAGLPAIQVFSALQMGQAAESIDQLLDIGADAWQFEVGLQSRWRRSAW
jgi:hypothetical protein